MKSPEAFAEFRLRAPAAPVKLRIFIVDDHPFVRRGLAAMVNAEPDLEVCGASDDPTTAVERLAALRPDVLLVDASARNRASLQLITAVRRADARIAIIALAMYDRAEYAREVLSAGATAFVLKVDVAERVLTAIRRYGRRPPAALVRATALRRAPRAAAPGELDEVEREIVAMIGRGLATQTIAVRLRLSRRAVERTLARVRTKLSLRTATELVRYCVRMYRRHRHCVAVHA